MKSIPATGEQDRRAIRLQRNEAVAGRVAVAARCQAEVDGSVIVEVARRQVGVVAETALEIGGGLQSSVAVTQENGNVVDEAGLVVDGNVEFSIAVEVGNDESMPNLRQGGVAGPWSKGAVAVAEQDRGSIEGTDDQVGDAVAGEIGAGDAGCILLTGGVTDAVEERAISAA